MLQGAQALLEQGEAALAAGDWRAARVAYRDALAVEDVPEAFFGLGTALWWLGEVTEAMPCWEAAYAGFRRRSDPVMAVNVAIVISFTYSANFGNVAVANGWSARAARLATAAGVAELQGWALLAKAATCQDPARAERQSREALGLAAGAVGRDLELCALSSLGSALVEIGRVEEGAALLDEALAGSLGGEIESLETVVFTSCVLVRSCYRCADFARVVEWTHALEPFIARYGNLYVNATCRTYHGAVLVAIGDWRRAEEELQAAGELAGRALPAVQSQVSAYLAELRLAQGRLDEALALLAGREDQPVVIPVLAAVHLARGEAAVAVSIARRRLERPGSRPIEGARLREMLGEAALLEGDVDAAVGEGRALARLGADLGCDLIAARGERLVGRALAEAGQPGQGKRHLDRALDVFVGLEMPWEAARTRLWLARALVVGDPAAAVAEARSALSVFEALGARGDRDRAWAWLRRHGADAAPSKPSGLAALTKREQGVLLLVGEGLPNPEIADRLYISRRTVEHHVASVLSKLGLRNRTEAAALALRHAGEALPPE